VRVGGRVLVGLSGGLDSVSLLHVLAGLRNADESSFRLSAVHVNHGISPHAEAWQNMCENFSAELAVPFEAVRVDVERDSKDGLEAAARRVRHTVFDGIDADVVMLAHHRDDQGETLLFNLLRGTGVAGAAAMLERNGRLLRPWLSIGRDAIAAYAERHKLLWCEDDSNADIRHSRNFLRHKVLPTIRERFPASNKNLAAAAGRFAEAQELLDELAVLDLGGATAFPVDLGCLKQLEEARARNALRFLLDRHGVRIPSEGRLREGLRQLLEAAADRHPVIVFGEYQIFRRRGRVYLEPVGASSESR
jgi:tRNA(Ile)-lysidine synthase